MLSLWGLTIHALLAGPYPETTNGGGFDCFSHVFPDFFSEMPFYIVLGFRQWGENLDTGLALSTVESGYNDSGYNDGFFRSLWFAYGLLT